MALTLYRKYRPKTFAELVGQHHIRVTLSHEVESGQLAHAYLFTGPRGVGKTTVARLLARAVNCPGRKGAEPDNACPACLDMLAGSALDIIEIDAASQTGVENVRENIIANARIAPGRLRYKVFIIDEVHMLSIGAFNALLKLLEEPPAHALFILATTEVHKVPETILSRCQRFDFHRVSIDDLKTRLTTLARWEAITVDEVVLDDLARRAEGSVRDAESLLGQLIALGEKRITADVAAVALPRTDLRSVLAFFDCFVRKDRVGAIDLLHTLLDEGISLPQFLRQFVEMVRAVFLLKLNPSLERRSLPALDAKQEQELLAVLPNLSVEELVGILEAFYDLERHVKASPVPQLPVELAVLQALPQPAAAKISPAPLKPARRSDPPPATPKTLSKKKAAPAKSEVQSALSLKTVEKSWPAIIQAMKTVNHGTALLLKSVVPAEVVDDTLIIAVRFPFHAERLMELKNRAQLEDTMAGLLGQKLSVKCVVAPKQAPAADAVASSIAEALGGEVL